jgi:type I restriction-modification system DNA methylase subunit
MANGSAQIVQKLWNYCNLLRDDGLSYGDYVEQLTFLLFLKMAHEQTQPPWERPSFIPAGHDWPSLLALSGDALETHYRHTLTELGKKSGMLGIIFCKAQNKIQDPAKLQRLIVEPPVRTADSLAAIPTTHVAVVLTNPPFGKKSSVMVVNEEGDEERQALTVLREDFWATTSNKQLNFVQHVKSLLKMQGRAAVVVPDNVLFEGGAGETVRRSLLHDCDVHTLLRLPTGIFYAQGVKANVLFFDRKPAHPEPWTQKVWTYDLRTNKHFTLKTNPLQRADLDEFVACYRPEARAERRPTWSEADADGRWRGYTYQELLARDKCSPDVFWLKDDSLEDSANLPDPDVIAAEIIEDLKAALEQFAEIQADLIRN